MPMRLKQRIAVLAIAVYWRSVRKTELNEFQRKQEWKSRLVDNSMNSFALIDVVKISYVLNGVDYEHDMKSF